ncbi:MAG: ABC transporter permease [Thiohalomonadales bacterium]
MDFSEQYIALRTIVVRELRRFLRIWIQTVLPAVITMALYFVIFGNLIGSQIGDMDGFKYMDYIVPGLIMLSVITNSYGNVVSSFYSAKFQRNVEEMLVSPVPNYIILLGYTAGGLMRGLIVGAAVTVVSLFFTQLQVYSYFVVVSIIMMTSILFSLAGFINAVFANSFDDISIVPTFVLTPLTYLGGIFYSISMLPDFWQIVSLFNPILYMVNAFRYGFLGTSDTNLLHSYLIISIAIISLYTFCLYLLNTGKGIRS